MNALSSVTMEACPEENCFDCLTDEILFVLFSFVSPTDLLRQVCTTCTRFADIVQSETFWRKAFVSTAKLLEHGQLPLVLSKHQLQRYALYQMAKQDGDARLLKLLQHGSVLACRETSLQLKKKSGRRTCAASTTDRDTESIENVLALTSNSNANFFRRFRFTQRWWSSRPTQQADARSEVLLFTTRAPLCLLTQVKIKPLLDPYMGVCFLFLC